jgi:excinuclease UvrABC nuclease subunit
MKVPELVPLPLRREPFKMSSFKSIPKSPGCYVLSTFENDILYIGLSDNLFERFQQHQNNREKTNPTQEGKAVWFYYSVVDDKNLPMLERTWLNQYIALHGTLPRFNKVNSPVA